MVSIRKTKKRLKRELYARKVLHNVIDDTAVKFQSEWLIMVTEFKLEILKYRGRFCAFKRRMERKIRKDGKWKEFCAFKDSYLRKMESAYLPAWKETQSQIEKYENLADHIYTQSDFLKDFDPTMHDVMAHREPIPFEKLIKQKNQ